MNLDDGLNKNNTTKSIYIVLHTLSVGGAERHASLIANYLAEKNYHVVIILIDNNKVDYKLSDNIKVIPLQNLDYPEKIKAKKPSTLNLVKLKLYSHISRKKFQLYDMFLYLQFNYVKKMEYIFRNVSYGEENIIISFMPIPNLICSAIKKKINCKLILVEFNSPQLEFPENAPENRLKRTLFPNADGFVFQTKEQMSFYDYLPRVKKKIIPNPLDVVSVQPYYGEERNKEIVNFCRLVKAKNLPMLVNAFLKIHKDFPEYTLVIYGDGPEKESIEKLIKESKISSNVFIRPFKNNVLQLVRKSAMFVSSSDREGISNSMLEAMAIGLPTICTDCPAGGARMFINNYNNGILVPVKDTDALYQAMKYMIEHPEEAKRMANNAVSIRETLDKEKILNEWKSFIELI